MSERKQVGEGGAGQEEGAGGRVGAMMRIVWTTSCAPTLSSACPYRIMSESINESINELINAWLNA